MSPFHVLTGLVAHYGYPGLALLVVVEGFGVPAPGQTAIVLAAGYAAHGRLSVVGVAAIAFLAAVLGDSIGYLIGRYGGRQLSARPTAAPAPSRRQHALSQAPAAREWPASRSPVPPASIVSRRDTCQHGPAAGAPRRRPERR